jgi:hypothetical protein
MMTTAVLVLLVTTATFGILILLRWLRRHTAGSKFPTALVALHLFSAVATLALWLTYMATDRLGWAWAALITVLATNGLGDLVLAGRWRLDAAVRGTWIRDYGKALGDLRNPRRRINAAHFVLAGTTTVLLAYATIAATV